jgi:hypothetical protein
MVKEYKSESPPLIPGSVFFQCPFLRQFEGVERNVFYCKHDKHCLFLTFDVEIIKIVSLNHYRTKWGPKIFQILFLLLMENNILVSSDRAS